MILKMNDIWKALALVVMITFSSFGQQRGPRGQQGSGQQGPPELPSTEQIEKMVDKMSNEILLSDEQETKVLELYKNHFEEIGNKTKYGRRDRSEMEEMKEDFEDDVKAVLTKDQQKLYTAYIKKNNKRERPQRK